MPRTRGSGGQGGQAARGDGDRSQAGGLTVQPGLEFEASKEQTVGGGDAIVPDRCAFSVLFQAAGHLFWRLFVPPNLA